jgi:hypothetical protein
VGKRRKPHQAPNPADVLIATGHLDVLFELADDGLFVYSGCCGKRLTRRQARQLRDLLDASLHQRG